MQSKATTVKAYFAELPPDRRKAIEALRSVILKNIDKGFEEGMQYGMISWHVPHSIYPAGYHCNPKQPVPFAGLAAQKNHISLYMMSVYGEGGDEAWLRAQFKSAGKKLDMGKSCIRFKTLDDVPLDVIGEAFRRVKLKSYLERYERMREAQRPAARKATAKTGTTRTKAAASKKKTANTATTKKAVKRKPATRKKLAR